MKNNRCPIVLKPFFVLMISLFLFVVVVIGFASSMNDLAVFYLLYALLPCTGGLAGLGLGYGIWKIINKL